MKIMVLNGSPKGDISVTMQYVKYMMLKFPEHEFQIAHVAHSVKRLENNANEFGKLMEDIKCSDGVLWAFPLYVYLVHGSYKRFIELIWEKDAADAFSGKYAAALSTSIHFFDNTAHNYIHAICDDLNMQYTGFFSPAMDDILEEKGRSALTAFASDFFLHMEKRLPTSRAYLPLNRSMPVYRPSLPVSKVDYKDKKIVVLTDSFNPDTNLGKMLKHFMDSFTRPVEQINISEINIKGGCLGCLKCGFDNRCVYDGKDDVRMVYDDKLKTADILVFAGTIADRYLSARWKTFIDRRFFNTHQPLFTGKQIGYIISGPLSGMQTLREILQANTELDQANLVGMVTDEYADSKHLDGLLESLAERLVSCSEAGYAGPSTFLGIGGMKLFRDEIWGRLRMVFQGDHRYYKKHGIYDFPQKLLKTRLINLVAIPLTKIPPIKKGMQKNFTRFMIRPYQGIMKDV